MQAIGRLAGDALAAGGALIEQTHTGIAQRAFGHAPASAPVRVLHDGISQAIYTGVRGALRGATVAASGLAAVRAPSGGAPLSSRPRAALGLGALNGIYGDYVARRAPALAFEMEIRRHGVAVDAAPEPLRAAFPDATSRLAVFVHGLCETDDSLAAGDRGPCGPTHLRRAPAGRALLHARCMSATTPVCTSPTTAARWPGCWPT